MVPVESLENPLTILKLEHIGEVFALFDYHGRKTLASHLVQAIVDKMAYITTAEEVEELFLLLAPMVKDQVDQPLEEVRGCDEGCGTVWEEVRKLFSSSLHQYHK